MEMKLNERNQFAQIWNKNNYDYSRYFIKEIFYSFFFRRNKTNTTNLYAFKL